MVKLTHASLLLLGSAAGVAAARPLSAAAFVGGGSSARGFAASARRSMAIKAAGQSLPIQAGEEVMSPKSHGTSESPVQKGLRWGCDNETADRICNFNRHYAEFAGYWATTKFLKEVSRTDPTDYFDSVTGNLLFTAPVGRSVEDYIKESEGHGWPSFRDEEVNWDYVRCLPDGECVSTTGTHLGHNIPDGKGNRYCINLVSVAGNPEN